MLNIIIDANKKELIELPKGSPYGSLDVDKEKCTICLSCVSGCPASALQDNPDAPQLSFREDACLQCGICVATCPEKAIQLGLKAAEMALGAASAVHPNVGDVIKSKVIIPCEKS